MFGFAKAFARWAFGFQAATCCGTAQSCAGYITRLTLKPADPSSTSLHIYISLCLALLMYTTVIASVHTSNFHEHFCHVIYHYNSL